ncbi:MAG: hypothetical protein GQ525_11585 [Draconibacterium sp.]|nr:hypothetical protein [Draconibacterium sp.]
MKRAYYVPLIFIFLLLNWIPANAQEYSSFEVSIKDGLSSNSINCTCVDHLGYVWFGTDYGLNRYDGFETLVFHNDPNDNATISNNNINNIYEDFSGGLWVMTN